jgi:Tol biopolymer transport system component
MTGDLAPSLSSDQKTVAFVRYTTLSHAEIYAVDLSGRNLRQLTNDSYSKAEQVMWSADGKYVVFISGRPDVRGPSRVLATGGPIEAAPTYPALGSMSRDGKRLAFVDGDGETFTWRAELAVAGGKVFSNTKTMMPALWEDSPQLTPDGEQVLVRRASRGEHDTAIWKTDIEGQNAVRLTSTHPGMVGSPRWSPDAKWIAMDYRPENHSQIYLVDSEGRNFHALTTHDSENEVPGWSRDGRSVYFTSNRTGDWQIWRRDLASGHETQVTESGGIGPFESYDGATLYYSKFDQGGIWRRPVSGGPEARVTTALHTGYWGGFAITEAGIYFLDADASPRPTIFYYDIRRGRTTPVLSLDHLPVSTVPELAASRDGRILLFTQLEVMTHINLAEASQ